MCERGRRASHNEGHGDQNIRPKQLRNREVPWEGSLRSKRMSRRTERPYKVDGAGKLAPHSTAPGSAPEINGPVVQREFPSLLREACNPSPSATAGAAASNGCRAGTGVSRGHSTESNEPATKRPEGLTTREALNLAGRHDHRWSCSRCDDADRPSTGQRSSWQRKSGCSIRQDCQEPPDADPHVRWCGGRGEQSRPPTRLGFAYSCQVNRTVLLNHGGYIRARLLDGLIQYLLDKRRHPVLRIRLRRHPTL